MNSSPGASRISSRRAATYAGVSRRVPLDLQKAGVLPSGDLAAFDVVLIQVLSRLPARRQAAGSKSAGLLAPLDVARELRASYARGELAAESILVAEVDRCAVLDKATAWSRALTAPEGALVLPVGEWLARAQLHFDQQTGKAAMTT